MNHDPKKIRARLRRYERELRKEKEAFGAYRDGGGKRYAIGPHYLLLGDDEGACEAFRWFQQEFPDDSGEPGHLLCWCLALQRARQEDAAEKKLCQTMLSNLYLLPYLLGSPISRLDIWHGSNLAEPEYVQWIPEEYFQLWSDSERRWAGEVHGSRKFESIRARYTEICRALSSTPRGPERSRLVDEMLELEGGGAF